MALTDRLERHLERRGALSDEERMVLRTLPSRRRRHEHDERIVSEGPAPAGSCLLAEGMAMRAHRIGTSERVVSALHVAGDFVDLHSFLLRHLDHDIVAIGPCVVDFVEAEHIQAIMDDHPRLARLLWKDTLIDAKIHRKWVALRAAQRGGQRIGHLLCELHARLAAVGLADQGLFSMPLDQRGIAEVLGYSVVHVNRAVQELRAAGFLAWERGLVRILDPEGLARFASFDPDYLELARGDGPGA